jgi:hypothetical protein
MTFCTRNLTPEQAAHDEKRGIELMGTTLADIDRRRREWALKRKLEVVTMSEICQGTAQADKDGHDVKRRVQDFRVPERIVEILAQGTDKTDAIQAVDAWANAKPWCLILSGDKGTGKSVAAAYWLWRFQAAKMQSSQTAKPSWFRVNDLMLMGNYNTDLRELWYSSRLVLDDVGNEFQDAKGSLAAMLYGIVDHRHGDMLKTIITTNLTLDEMKKRYDPRIMDRLREGAEFVNILGTSMRAPTRQPGED